jgi:hypothetical protein
MSVVAEVAVGIAVADVVVIGTAIGIGASVKLYKRHKRRQLVKKLTKEVFTTEEITDEQLDEIQVQDQVMTPEDVFVETFEPYNTNEFHIERIEYHNADYVIDDDFDVDFDKNFGLEEVDVVDPNTTPIKELPTPICSSTNTPCDLSSTSSFETVTKKLPMEEQSGIVGKFVNKYLKKKMQSKRRSGVQEKMVSTPIPMTPTTQKVVEHALDITDDDFTDLVAPICN